MNCLLFLKVWYYSCVCGRIPRTPFINLDGVFIMPRMSQLYDNYGAQLMTNYNNYSQYKVFFEAFGAATTAKLAGITREHMTRLGKKNGWKAPKAEQAQNNLVKLLIKGSVQAELKQLAG